MVNITPRRSRRLAGLPPVSVEEDEEEAVKEHAECSLIHTNESVQMVRRTGIYALLSIIALKTLVIYFFSTSN